MSTENYYLKNVPKNMCHEFQNEMRIKSTIQNCREIENILYADGTL